MNTLFFGFIAASMLYGQSGSLATPEIGFVFDTSSHSLRPLQGVPGAAMVGGPVEFGFVPANAYIAPQADAAFVSGEGGAPHFFRLTGAGAAETAIDKLASFQQVVYSPSGTAAALISSTNIQILKGLSQTPAIAGTLTQRVQAGRRQPPPQVLAVTDDGAYLLRVTGGIVELVGAAGESRQIADALPGLLAAFAPASHDAALYTPDNLIIFNDLQGSGTSRKLPSVLAASALTFAPDGRSLLIASAANRTVTSLQVDTGEPTALPCDCVPTALARTGNFYRLNDLGKGPLWFLNPASRTLFFIPR